MTESLRKTVHELEIHLPELKTLGSADGLLHDLYEAAEYSCQLGRWVLEGNTRVNYADCARGQLKFLSELSRAFRSRSAVVQSRYIPIIEAIDRILRSVEKVHSPKDGHLAVLRIIRERFQFLETDYNFSIVDTQPTGVRFSSGAVYLKLGYGITLGCSFGPAAEPQRIFWINDLLFMNGDPRYRTLPEDNLDTETSVEHWFAFLAGVFKQYGHPVLSNEPGIFARLAKAQAERDAEYVREANSKSALEKHGADGTA